MKTIIHKHHIIPKHAGGTNDLSNLVELTRLEHSWVHWWMWCNERKDVFNLLESKGVKITKEMIQHIPWQDRNDSSAAGIIGLGEIDGINQIGKNNPNWKDGRSLNSEEYDQTPARKSQKKSYRERPEVKARKKKYNKEYNQRLEVIARKKELGQTPKAKAKKKESNRKYNERKKQLKQ
tara:strand:+ start:233 stop:769 length:537 start_codon:yes stop_codon:yes gene_type:complete